LRAHGFGEVFAKLGVRDLAWEGLFYAEGGAFVEFFCFWLEMLLGGKEGENITFQDFEHGAVVDFAKSQALQDLTIDMHKHVQWL
jgi:hypothetical protein